MVGASAILVEVMEEPVGGFGTLKTILEAIFATYANDKVYS